MTARSRTAEALGAIVRLLVEHEAKVGLNEIRDILEALDAAAYQDGFRDGQDGAAHVANLASERAGDLDSGSGDPPAGGEP